LQGTKVEFLKCAAFQQMQYSFFLLSKDIILKDEPNPVNDKPDFKYLHLFRNGIL